MRRLLLVLIVALGLAPGLVWRNAPPAPDFTAGLMVDALDIPTGDAGRIGGAGGPWLTGAWHLSSRNTDFGSYSALLAPGGNELVAISDRGRFLRFPMPGTRQGRAAFGTVLPGSDQFKPLQDMESATRDPATGRIWLGLEGRNAFVRLNPDLSDPHSIAPLQMRRWRSNGGPEAMVRLADGRFVVMAESPPEWRDKARQGVIFAGDPIENPQGDKFSFIPPSGYDPADMAQLPDGRVLILLRGVSFLPPGFTVRLLIADPADLRAGEPWAWRNVGELKSPMPMDNYEGIAVTGGKDGGPVTLWIISDDNASRVIQSTLLLRFEWQVPARATAATRSAGHDPNQ